MAKAHLFVLVHGLWGGANHLKAIDDTILQCVNSEKEEIHTLRPTTSSLFKTYDGIELIGERMLIEIIDKINTLHDAGISVTKISFVGYSLGGLVSRFIIGELHKMKVFETIEPMFFCTFASPHLGVHFFKKRFKMLNFLGSNLIGFVGSELFISDKRKILVELSMGDYIEGLSLFKERFCFANIRHDRTVNFYSAYITNRNPFDQHWDKLDLSFDHGDMTPTYRVRGIEVEPKIVNMKSSKFHGLNKPVEKKPLWKKIRLGGIILAAFCILPIWIPFICTVSTVASCVSYFIVKNHKKTPLDFKHGSSEQDSTTTDSVPITERLQEVTGEAFENAINMGQYDTSTESARDPSSKESISTLKPIGSLSSIRKEFENPDHDDNFIFQETTPLKLSRDCEVIMKNLNALQWNKFGCYVNVLNAHDGIVARKGLKKSTVKGVATVRFFAELVNEKLKQ